VLLHQYNKAYILGYNKFANHIKNINKIKRTL